MSSRVRYLSKLEAANFLNFHLRGIGPDDVSSLHKVARKAIEEHQNEIILGACGSKGEKGEIEQHCPPFTKHHLPKAMKIKRFHKLRFQRIVRNHLVSQARGECRKSSQLS